MAACDNGFVESHPLRVAGRQNDVANLLVNHFLLHRVADAMTTPPTACRRNWCGFITAPSTFSGGPPAPLHSAPFWKTPHRRNPRMTLPSVLR